MRAIKKGLTTGLILQLAIGPVFFYIINLTLQKSTLDGLAGVIAVTTVDLLYIGLSILGLGQILEHAKIKTAFGALSALVLMVFGLVIIKGAVSTPLMVAATTTPANPLASFISVFILTISSPMTIVFFTSLFSAKAVEYNFNRKDLLLFGLGTGLATLIFMGTSVVLFSFVKGTVPAVIIRSLNILVGCLLIAYGAIRLFKTFHAVALKHVLIHRR